MEKFHLRITTDLGFEFWQDIPEDKRYQISIYGRVRNGSKILKPNFGTDGYFHIHLYEDGQRKVRLIHRLVAEAFIPNFNGKREVNHKDENKLSNVCWNLEWLSSQENANYGTRNARAIETKKEKGLMSKVSMFDLVGNFIKSFDSMADAARYVHGNRTNICACCNNKAKTAYGYRWRYE